MIDDAAKNKIIEMWNAGSSGSEIATALNLTRNAILGFVHRQRRSGVFVEERASGRNNEKEKAEKKKAKIEKKIEVKPKIRMEMPRVDITSAFDINEYFSKPITGVSLLDLSYYSCRFIVTTENDKPPVYCGERVDRGSYCKPHADRCYIPARIKLEKLLDRR